MQKEFVMIIGRENEISTLKNALTEEYSQFIAVYGRRRVGKTFLVREAFSYKFAFQFTGAAKTTNKNQLMRFAEALREQGLQDVTSPKNWMQAFSELRRFISQLPVSQKKVVFLDELPWMDSPRSGFLSELEVFWNGWCSARKDIVLVVCGSSTSWMIKKIIKNKGGLHNRLNHRIALKPFPLRLCKDLLNSRGINFSDKQLLECYMIFGGVPYYWSLLKKGASLSQEIDRLIFSGDGELHDEFDMLYAALFKTPEPYLKIISTLAKKKSGMTRAQIIEEAHIESNGHLSDILNDLEWCGFIRSYSFMGNQVKGEFYQLIDLFTLFYYAFKNKRRPANYWQSTEGSPERNTWHGLAYEKVCLWHVDQIKRKLGISGVLTDVYSWYCKANKELGREGVQIDLILDRRDGVIDLCEIKYSKDKYAISDAYAVDLRRKAATFNDVTKTKKAVHMVMITTDGLLQNAYSSEIQNEVELEDLFK